MIRKTVMCDECFDTADTPDGIVLASTAAGARSDAKKYAAWHRSKGRDLCEQCWDEGAR